MKYSAAERAAIAAYERYMDAKAAFLAGPGPETSLPPYPDIRALKRAIRKGYKLTRGEPTRLLLDDW